MRYSVILSILFALLAPGTVTAQEKTTVTLLLGSKGIEIRFITNGAVPSAVNNLANYKLFELSSSKIEAPLTDRTPFLNAGKLSCDLSLGGYCDLELGSWFDATKSYILVIENFQPNGDRLTVSFKFALTADITGPFDPAEERHQVRVVSQIPIKGSLPMTVERSILRVAPGSQYVMQDKRSRNNVPVKNIDPNKTDSTTITLNLEKSLEAGKVHTLRISQGIVDQNKQTVIASGKVELGGTAPNTDQPKVTFKLSSNSAVGQKSVFDFSGKFTPIRNIYDSAKTSGALWEPSAEVDVGLRSTKSANSIVLSLLRTQYLTVHPKRVVSVPPCRVDPCKDWIPIPTYAGWRATPWYRLSDVKFYIGPRGEFDRKFKRINALGNIRFDFDFHRLFGSVSQERNYILNDLVGSTNYKADLKTKSSQLEGINFGWKFVPYLSTNFGGHVNNETVKKTIKGQELSVVVPQHGILRFYGGFVGSLEWRTFSIPTTLTLDDSIIYMATREKIGYTTDSGVFLRQVRGFQPHFSTSLDFAIDSARHYSFNITYEDGRVAPNFEYLNKLTSGIKVLY